MKNQLLYKFSIALMIVILAVAALPVTQAHALACVITTNTNWNALTCGTGGGVPTAADTVEIRNGATLTVNVTNAVAASVQVGGVGGAQPGTLTFSGANPSLTVSGNLNVGGWGNNARTGTVTFTNTASLTAANVILGGTGATPASGTITMTAGGTLTTGGLSMGAGGGTWTPGAGTVIMTATNTLPAATITSFNNLTINGGTTALGVATTINGNLNIASGTLATNNLALTLNGNFTNSGTFTAGSSAITFAGTAAQNVAGFTTTGAVTTTKTTGTVTFGGNVNAASLTMNNTATGSTVVALNGNALTLTGALTLQRPAGGGVTNTVQVGAGTLMAGSIILQGTGAPGRTSVVSITTGTVNVSGNITSAGVQSQILFTGAGNLNVGGDFMTGTQGTFTAGTGTVHFNGGATQIIAPFAYSFNNLNLSGAGLKTIAAGVNSQVNALALSGVGQVNGTWGGTGSGAANTRPFIFSNSSGFLTVLNNTAPVTYTVTYALGGGTGTLPTQANVSTGGTFTVASGAGLSRVGYTFSGWNDGAANYAAGSTYTMVASNVTLTALWTPTSQSVTYALGGGIGTLPTQANVNTDGMFTVASGVGLSRVGYTFAGWNDGAANYAAGSTYTMGASNVTLTAQWMINTYTLTYNAGVNGSLTGVMSQTVDHGANGTAVTAVPNTGYHFVSWSDGVLTPSRTDTAVTANINVTATFAINTYTLTYNAGANGSLTGVTSQTVDHGVNGTAVTAVPNTGYHFVSWSDGVLTPSRTDTAVTANINVTANFAINTYTLTYNAGANGSLTGITSQTVNHGANGTAVTAVPNTGYHFVSWSDGVLTPSRTDSNVTENLAVTANFAINTYTLTYTSDINGSITGTSPQTVNHGANGTAVTAVPNTGYHFVSWSDGVLTPSRTDSNVTGNITATANFVINTYSSTYTAGVNGTITGTSLQTVNHGANGTAVTAVPNTGYHFVSWSDGVLTPSRTDNNVTANITATATFAINTYTLTYTAGVNGTITGTSPQTVNHGANGTAVTAVPNTGYHFVSWSDGVLTATRTSTNVTANLAVTANFAINTYTLTYTAGANGTITGTSPQTVNHGANGTAVTAVPNTGYHFVSWSDGVLTPSRTDTSVTANINVTANFAINTYTLTYTAGANGTITGTSPQTVNHGANGTAVTAVPNTGYHFVSWSDGVLTATRTSTNVTANLAVTANFAINTYTLTYTAGANGTITGTSPQTVNHGANGTTVTAVPNTGYHFVNWSDGVLTASRTSTNVNANLAVTANFAINTYTLTYTAGANGTITGTSPQTVNHGANGTAVTAVPNTGYHFVSWSDGVLTDTRTDSNVTAPITATATFAINTYTLTYNAGANGSLTGVTSQTLNHGANGTGVTAVPNTGYHFVSWSDGVLNPSRTDTNVTANITSTANFAINTYTLTYTAGANGSLTGITSQVVNYGTDGTAVTAVPDTDYHFVDWSDGVLAATRTDTNVTANVTVTANFVVNPTPTASITNSPVTYNGSVQTAAVACLGGGAATLASGGSGIDAGSYAATVDCAASAGYIAANSLPAGNFVIDQASQIITVTTNAPAKASNGSTFNVTATASSGLTVSITTAGVCSSVDNGDGTAAITMTSGNGTCNVFYNQVGNVNYTAAVPVQENVDATEGPSFTSGNTTTFDAGFAGSFNVTATGTPLTMTIVSAGALPSGVTLTDNGNGTAVLSGTPAIGTNGTYNLVFTANNGVNPNGTQAFTLIVKNGPTVGANGINSTPDTGDGSVTENESIIDTLGLSKLTVQFSQDVYDDPTDALDFGHDVTNPANYILVRSTTNSFATIDCAGGVVAPDVSIKVNSVTYSNGGGSGPYIATLFINDGFPLNVVGFYRLYVCGTTSIVDANNRLLELAGNGTTPGTDFQRNFRIATAVVTDGGRGASSSSTKSVVTNGFLIPVTGFAPDQVTTLPIQPADKMYTSMGQMTIEIPTLGVKFPIVGASITNKTWDLTWLKNSVAYLEGSAYPTTAGNTVLTAHVQDANKNLGPFSDIKGMQLGQNIYIHVNGQVYVYQVQENSKIASNGITSMFKHEEDSWITLVTCEDYNAKTGVYSSRRMVRAVLISVIPEKK